MIQGSPCMTLMSYVDNSVEIGDFFSYYVKNVEEMEKLCTFLICKLIGEKNCKNIRNLLPF